MKYEKAKVTIINLGNEDILTCSGERPQYGCNTNNWQTMYYGHNNRQTRNIGSIWVWFGGFKFW